jgi:hypothetical protein
VIFGYADIYFAMLRDIGAAKYREANIKYISNTFPYPYLLFPKVLAPQHHRAKIAFFPTQPMRAMILRRE